MKLHELAPKIAKKSRKRVGRGNGSGHGTYCGRGCNGQNARSGGGVRLGFEGGQSGVLQRMPKMRGFKNPTRIETRPLSLSFLDKNFEDGEKVNFEVLLEKNLLANKDVSVKILGNGEITKKVEIEGIQTSASAKKKIEKAGGKVNQGS